MFGNNIDTLVLFSSVNRHYFSKVDVEFGCVILHGDEKIYLTDFRYYSYLSSELSGWNVIKTSVEKMFDKINAELTRLNAEIVGYEVFSTPAPHSDNSRQSPH